MHKVCLFHFLTLILQATSYADRLRLAIAVIHGEAQKDIEETLKQDGRQSPPFVDNNPDEADSGVGESSTAEEVAKEEEKPGRKESTTFELYPTMVNDLFYDKDF